MNLSNLSNLHAFSLLSIVNCKVPRKRKGRPKPPPFPLLHDINMVLSTIPESNRITNLAFDFTIIGLRPFPGCLDQDWVGMFNQVIRIACGKPLELEVSMGIDTLSMGFVETDHPGEDKLYMSIMEKAASLSDYPKICTHWWNPTFWSRGVRPFPRGQVRSRCRR